MCAGQSKKVVLHILKCDPDVVLSGFDVHCGWPWLQSLTWRVRLHTRALPLLVWDELTSSLLNPLHISELVCDSLNMYLQQMCVCVWVSMCVCVFQVLHSMVSSVERPPAISAGCQLILRCKDFRVFQILIPQERDCADIHASLLRLSRPGMLKNNVKVNLFMT